MMSQALKQAVTGKKEESTFPALLEKHKSEIARALPKHLSADRMARIALTAFRQNPKLGECDPVSVFAAVIQSSQLGLEIGTLGRAYLVPYKVSKKIGNTWKSHCECQFIPGWRGLVDLVNRSGQASVWGGAVFEGDTFDYELGDRPFLTHKPSGEDDASKITHVYAIGRVKGAEWPVIELWPIKKIIKHRDRFNKVGENHYSFSNWEMYARKIPLLQVLKYMPLSPELVTAISLNDAAESGKQDLNVKDVIEGTWTPAEPDKEEETEREIQSQASASESPQHLTFHQVSERLMSATDVDLLDAAIDFASMVQSQEARATLVEIYKKRREELAK